MPITLPPQKQVLILGARGRLGYACLQAFAKAGWRVLAHLRSNNHSLLLKSKDASSQVCWIDTALTDPQQLDAMLEQHGPVHVVINAMASKFSVTEWKQKLAALNGLGISVARHTQALLIQPLAVLAYGQNLPAVLLEGERTPEHVWPEICALRAQTEQQLRDASGSGLRVCSLRIGTLYGQAGWGWISAAVAKNIKRGKFDWLGPYDVPTPWAYAPDVAATIERIACNAGVLTGYTSLHFAGQLRTGEDWLQAMEAGCMELQWLKPGQQLQAGQVQWALWKPVALFSPVIRALGQMQYIWRTPHRLDNTQLCALIGPEPATPWQQSINATLALLHARDDLHGGLVRTHQGY